MSQCSFRAYRRIALLTLLPTLAVIAPLTFAGQSGQPTAVDKALANNGERTYRVYCSSCHGPGLTGDGPLAKDLKVPPANLTELTNHNDGEFPYAMVLETIAHGRSVRGHGTEDMPAWADAFEMSSQSKEAATQKMEELAHFLWLKQAK